jgi:hypothetical protein
MDFNEFNRCLGQLRAAKQKQLNEIYWWVSISLSSLDFSLRNNTFTDTVKITVPSGKSTREISRTKEQVTEILTQAKSSDIYYSVYVFIVAQVEDFFSNLVFLVLSTDNRRLKTSVNGIDSIKKFEVEEILESETREKIIEKIIRKNLVNLFYAGPSKQKEYFEKVIGINIDDEIWDQWFEFKATRDIIVHNSGIINELYLEKAGKKSRGENGRKIIVDDNYFGTSISIMKTLIGKCEVAARKSLTPRSE